MFANADHIFIHEELVIVITKENMSFIIIKTGLDTNN